MSNQADGNKSNTILINNTRYRKCFSPKVKCEFSNLYFQRSLDGQSQPPFDVRSNCPYYGLLTINYCPFIVLHVHAACFLPCYHCDLKFRLVILSFENLIIGNYFKTVNSVHGPTLRKMKHMCIFVLIVH